MKLFTLFGIQVRADIYALFLLLLATTNSAGLAMGYAHISALWAFPVGLLMGLAIIASIVAHEYGHALVARAFRMEVGSIYIQLLGGVAQLKSPFPSARAELWTALAGPLVSFALAFLCITPSLSFLASSSIAMCIGIVGISNLLLGMFNLIPAFPLDGGRILRAAIWGLSDNFDKSTRIASYTGYTFGIVFGTMGLLTCVGVLSGGFASGIWSILLAIFVAGAAHMEAKKLPCLYTTERPRPEDFKPRDRLI